MFKLKFINPEIESLRQRIVDLEKLSESLLSSNRALMNQLSESKQERDALLQKIFDLTGVNQRRVDAVNSPPTPITNRTGNWGQVKQILELKAREEYWLNKRKEDETRRTSSLDKDIENLEKEIHA